MRADPRPWLGKRARERERERRGRTALGSPERNYAIDFWRFAFCLNIVLYHYHHSAYMFQSGDALHFRNGYLGVEFFLIVTGYLFIASFERRERQGKGNDTPGFMLHKLKPLYPHFIFTFFITYFGFQLIAGHALSPAMLKGILPYTWELLLLSLSGLGKNLNGPVWYLSAITITMFFMHQLLLKNKRFTLRFTVPAVTLFGYAWMFRTYGHLGVTHPYVGVVMAALVRAAAGMGVGILIYCACERAKEWKPLPLGRLICSGVELLMLGGTIAATIVRRGTNEGDFVLVLCIAAGVFISFAGLSYDSCVFRHPVFQYLGKLSYAIYLNQYLVLKLHSIHFAERHEAPVIAAGVLALIVFSMFTLALVELLTKACRKWVWPKLKAVFIGRSGAAEA